MATARLASACERYAEARARGESARFADFLRETREDWRHLSADVARRWKLPEHRGEREDIEQEMLVGALKAFRKFDPSRGTPLVDFIVFGALASAKKKVHKMRGAKLSGNSGKNPSRIERPFSSMGEKTGGENGDRTSEGAVEAAMARAGMFDPPNQEERFEFEERRSEVMPVCRNTVENSAAEALFDGLSLDDGAAKVYEDPDVRLAYRLGCEDSAKRLIGIAALALAERLDETVAA